MIFNCFPKPGTGLLGLSKWGAAFSVAQVGDLLIPLGTGHWNRPAKSFEGRGQERREGRLPEKAGTPGDGDRCRRNPGKSRRWIGAPAPMADRAGVDEGAERMTDRPGEEKKRCGWELRLTMADLN